MPDRFDMIIVADFRFPGGTSTAIADEVRAARAAGLKLGALQWDAPLFARSNRPRHPRLQDLVDRGEIVMLTASQHAQTPLLVVHNPYIMTRAGMPLARIEADTRIMVAHQTPTDARGRLYYDPWQVEKHAAAAFGGPFVWAPISPVCRDSFDRAGVDLPRLDEDWTNVIFVDDWGRPRTAPRASRPVIGRHSRVQRDKWPDGRCRILEVYPDDPGIEVRLLGVGSDVRKLVGEVPGNWTAWDFNEVAVTDFLAGIDFFVYYHHPALVEAFGRTIAEAAAAGCVCILPPHFERTFGPAALYRPAGEAAETARSLAGDPEAFARQSARGRAEIDARFGPEVYRARLRRILRSGGNQAAITVAGGASKPLRVAGKRALYHTRSAARTGVRLPVRAARRLAAAIAP